MNWPFIVVALVWAEWLISVTWMHARWGGENGPWNWRMLLPLPWFYLRWLNRVRSNYEQLLDALSANPAHTLVLTNEEN